MGTDLANLMVLGSHIVRILSALQIFHRTPGGKHEDEHRWIVTPIKSHFAKSLQGLRLTIRLYICMNTLGADTTAILVLSFASSSSCFANVVAVSSLY